MANINISQILIKRGNTAAAGNYIGPLGELVVDTGLKTVRVQDGVTPGGMAVLATLTGFNQLSGNIANLQTTTANISANLSAFQTYANATFGTSNFGNANVASYLSTSSIVTDINANVTAANLQIANLWSNAGVQADTIAILTANAGVQSANIATLFANAGVQADAIVGANAAIVTANTALKGYVDTQLGTLTNGASTALDTLLEIGTALGNNANFSATMITWLGNVTANTTAANTAIDTLQANLGSYYTWANANVAGLYGSITAANTAWQANAGVQADAIASLISNAAVQSANIATLVANAGVQADAITSLTANAGVQSANIATLFSNAGVQADAITSLQANITAANLAIAAASGTYSNTNVAAYLSASTTGNVGAGNLTVVNNFSTNVISANSFTYANGVSILAGIGGTYGNANVAAYLTAGTSLIPGVTLPGNVFVGPTSGSAGVPKFRPLVTSDLPDVSGNISSYLPTYSGNIAGNIVKNGYTWTFGTTGTLTFPDTTVQTTAFSNAAVATYLANYDGGINFTTSPAVITGLGNISSANFTFGNGINILSTVAGTYSNTNVAAYLTINSTVTALQANLGATQIWANANIASLQANLGVTQLWANANIASINANIGGFYTWANTNFGTSSYSNTNANALLSSNTISTINTTGNIKTIANVISPNYLFANGVNILSTITAVANLSTLTSNIGWTAVGATPPTFTTTSNGTKIVLWPSISSTMVDYAIGIEAGNTWFSIPQATNNFGYKWYAGNTTIATLSGNGTLTTGNITTTGNVSATNFVGNGAGLTNVTVSAAGNIVGTSSNVTLVAGNYSYTFDNTGNVTLPANVFVGVTNTFLPNTVASFSANVNYYSQVTLQNKNSGNDATADYIVTADNGSDTVNFLDLGIINSGYDNTTPSNSLGNIVFAADSYIYAQGNTSNANQSGGNLAIGTVTTGKTIKFFTGGTTSSAIAMTVANTGVTVSGNLTTNRLTTVTGVFWSNGTAWSSSGGSGTDDVLRANVGAYQIYANANLGTATTNITALQANLGGYYIWANANVAGLSSQITGANAAIVTANSAVVSYINTLNTAMASNVAGANAAIVTANTAMKSYVDAGNTTQSNQINSINANLGSYYTWANANVVGLSSQITAANAAISALQANVGSYYTWANANVAGLSTNITGANASIATLQANLGSYYTWANANVASLQSSITSLATNANANTAAYLAAGISTNVTTTGNVTSAIVNANTIYLGGNLLTINNATTPVGFRATTPVTNMSVNNGATVTMLFGTEEVDTNSAYNPATGKFTPNIAGYYSIDWFIVTSANGAGELIASLYKNGVLVAWGTNQTTATAHWNGVGGSTSMVYLNGTTDYISVILTNNSGSTATILAASGLSYFSAYLIR